MRSIAALACLGALLLTGCRQQREPGTEQVYADENVTITDVRFSSASLGRTMMYRAVVPRLTSGELRPVLYFLHGSGANPASTAIPQLITLAKKEGLIVVLPDGEYSWYTNAKHKGKARWEDAIYVDLLGDVAKRLPILSGPEHTGISGISMGGYGAAKIALKHPETFGWVGTMGGAFDITSRPPSLKRYDLTWRVWRIFGFRRSTRMDEDVFRLLQTSQSPTPVNWFLSCGEKDPLLETNRRFALALRQHRRTVIEIRPQYGHDWNSVNEALPAFFQEAGAHLRWTYLPASSSSVTISPSALPPGL